MSEQSFHAGSLDEAIAALTQDLVAASGPQISTMRNYRFAILPYLPKDEFKLRQGIRRLVDTLRADGWGVLSISLQQLLLDRIRATGQANVEALIDREKRLFAKDPERGLAHLRDKIAPHIEGVVRAGQPASTMLREAVRANVRASADHLRHGSVILEELVLAGRVSVVCAEYELETGAVHFFDDVP